MTYGVSSDADLRVVNLESGPNGTSFSMTRYGRDLGRLAVPLPGEHNALNAAAAVAVSSFFIILSFIFDRKGQTDNKRCRRATIRKASG